MLLQIIFFKNSFSDIWLVDKNDHIFFILTLILLLQLLSHFSRVRLCATPQTAAHQAPLSLGFSRQEHWSGLPFPSPVHESESEDAQSCPTLCNPIDGSPPGSPAPGILQARTLGVGCHFLLQCMKVKSESEVAQSCPTQRPHGLQATRLHRPWDFPGKSTGVGCHCLLRVCT